MTPVTGSRPAARRRTRALSDEEYAALCQCACALLPTGHAAGACAQLRSPAPGTSTPAVSATSEVTAS